jgi:hypothetical protein
MRLSPEREAVSKYKARMYALTWYHGAGALKRPFKPNETHKLQSLMCPLCSPLRTNNDYMVLEDLVHQISPFHSL